VPKTNNPKKHINPNIQGTKMQEADKIYIVLILLMIVIMFVSFANIMAFRDLPKTKDIAGHAIIIEQKPVNSKAQPDSGTGP
jgi:hypothetical protein